MQKPTDSFLICFKSTDWPIKVFFITGTEFLISSISFCYILRVSISLLTLLVCSCMFSVYSIDTLNVLIIVISPSLSCNSKLPLFVSLVLLFALSFRLSFLFLFSMSYNSLLKVTFFVE